MFSTSIGGRCMTIPPHRVSGELVERILRDFPSARLSARKPLCPRRRRHVTVQRFSHGQGEVEVRFRSRPAVQKRSEEHTSELQSHLNLVCRLLLDKRN